MDSTAQNLPAERLTSSDERTVELIRSVLKEIPQTPIIYRDPSDIVAINRQRLINGFSLLLVALLSGFSFYLYLRKPDLITAQVDASGRKVVSINNREFGQTDAVILGKDNLNVDDKKQLLSEFFSVNIINQQTRQSDINRALKCIIPAKREKFLKEELVESGQLANEKQEMWSSNWNIQDFQAKDSGNDHSFVRVIGTLELSKVINGEVRKENVQLQYEFLLLTDGSRSNTPFRTGFFIADWKKKELSRTSV